jgi:hypothetical protein
MHWREEVYAVLPVVLCGSDIWFLVPTEEHRLNFWKQSAEENV